MGPILIVDRERRLAAEVASGLSSTRTPVMMMSVVSESDFAKARAAVRTKSPRLLVTALRLGAYNGLHLAYVAAAMQPPTRSVVHTDAPDAVCASDVRAAHAFYEIRSRLRVALQAYVAAELPSEDRRNPLLLDRRRLARGGRRAADLRPQV